jgi:hypothetical protein
MTQSTDKVHTMQDYKSASYDEEPLQDVGKTSPRDMGKAAIIISILSVVLLVIFFFGLNQNLAGLNEQVEELGALEGEISRIDQTVAAVDGKVGALDTRLTELETLPQKTRNMLIDQSLNELTGRLNYMSGYLGDEQKAEKIYEAMQLLKQVQVDLKQ